MNVILYINIHNHICPRNIATAGSFSGNVLRLYSGSTRFESVLEFQLSSLIFLVVFLSLSN